MKIQNSQDFSHAKLKSRNPQTTRRNMTIMFCVCLVLQSLMLFAIIKHLFTGYLGNSKFIVPRDTNYCSLLCLEQQLMSRRTMNLLFAAQGDSWCLWNIKLAHYPHTSQFVYNFFNDIFKICTFIHQWRMQVTYIIEFIIIGSNLYTREYQFNSEMGVIY